ncbi:MAG: hypothetical protein V4693_00475 [Pseudomonadota bacterium]
MTPPYAICYGGNIESNYSGAWPFKCGMFRVRQSDPTDSGYSIYHFYQAGRAFCVKYGLDIVYFDREIAEVSPIKKLCANKNS